MTNRIIKQHPCLDSSKPSLVEREAYLKQLDRLQKASQPSKAYQEMVDQLRKAAQPSKAYLKQLEAAERLRKIFEQYAKH